VGTDKTKIKREIYLSKHPFQIQIYTNILPTMKFLIIRFSPVGAIVLTSPLLRCLRKAFPDATIHFLVDGACRSAVEFNPHIDKLHVLAHSRELMIEELKTEEYDHIIDLQNDHKSQVVSKALGKKPFVAGSKTFWSIFSSPEKSHIAELQFRSLRSFEITNDGNGLDYFIAAHEGL
jgi:ADP-heptose:LPS heptosyltransferase